MTLFIDLGLVTSPQSLADVATSSLAQAVPGYVPRPGQQEVILIDVLSPMAAEVANVAGQVPSAIFRSYGTELCGVPYETGSVASVSATFGLADALGHTVPAGTIVTIGDFAFLLAVDLTIPANQSSGTGLLLAAEKGSAYNSLGATGSAATGVALVTAVDAGGYSLPGGTALDLGGFGFTTATDLLIPAGARSAGVLVQANTNGSDWNGLTGAMTPTPPLLWVQSIIVGAPTDGGSDGSAVDLASGVDWITSVVLQGATSGGADPETDSDYQNRLAGALALQAPRPITAKNFSVMARSFTPANGTDQEEVGRATAIDGYDPTTDSVGHERTVTLFVTDTQGLPLNTDTKQAVSAWLESLREVNFIVNVVDPTYTPVYVTVAVQASRSAALAVAPISQQVQDALTGYLSPAAWGLGDFGDQFWNNEPYVRYNKLIAVVEALPAVDYVTSMTIGATANPTRTSDLRLNGPAPLPVSSALTVPAPVVQAAF